MKKYIQTSIIVLLALGISSATIISCIDGKGETVQVVRKSDPVPVKILELESTEQSTPVLTSGKITTDNETFLSFKTAGILNEVFVQEGDRIKKGQVLASINPREINAIVSQAMFVVEKSERDFQRVENLYQDSVATLEQMQNAETALNVAKEQLRTAEFNKQYSTIVALHDGYVLKKFGNPGQVVGIGDPILMVNGVSGNDWILRVNASDRQWSAIRIHDNAAVKLDAFADKTFQAKVLRKSETSDPSTGTFSVDLLVNNSGEKLASGMFGSATISTATRTQVWAVPYEAVLDANGNEGFVFVTLDYKTAIKQPVTISSIEKDKIYIAAGLKNYHALIISGTAYLNHQSDITILK